LSKQLTELIIFDCDGVLVDSEPLSAQATVVALAEFGVHMDAQQALQAFTGITFAAAVAKVRIDYDIDLPPLYASRHAELVAQAFRQKLQPISGVVQTLTSLRLPFCVGSNSSQARLAMTFEATGLSHFFKGHVYSGEDVAQGKPAPDLFLHAAAHFDVAPEHCLVVDDSPSGITAAVRAGMPAIGFVGGGHASPALRERLLQVGARWIVDDFRKIANHIQTAEHAAPPL
jgi:HAD superfamily hydrolase (TIGR01509 family)